MTRITTRFGAASTADEVVADIDLTGTRAVVTGASSGISVETTAYGWRPSTWPTALRSPHSIRHQPPRAFRAGRGSARRLGGSGRGPHRVRQLQRTPGLLPSCSTTSISAPARTTVGCLRPVVPQEAKDGWVELEKAGRITMKTTQQGAATTLVAAVAPEFAHTGGHYLEDCNEAETVADEAQVSSGVREWALLWDTSVSLLGQG